MKHVDVLVRGAGIVGQSLALSLARLGLQVGLRPEEPRAKADPAAPDVRAYALNASSVALLKSLKVWDALPAHAATPVYDMHVQGDAEGAAIAFSASKDMMSSLLASSWSIHSNRTRSEGSVSSSGLRPGRRRCAT